MSNGTKAPRRYIPPSGNNIGRTVTITKDVNITDVIATVVSVIKQQVDNLAARSNMGATLESDDVKNLRVYSQSLTELSREDRERTKHEGQEEFLKNLTPEELIKMVQAKLGQAVSNSQALEVDSVATTERSKEE